MPAEVLSHEVGARRATMAALSAVLVVFAVLVVGLSAGLQSTMADLTDAMPAAVTAFIPVGPGGYAVGELFTLIAPLALIGFAVTSGAALVAGEEQAGTMSMLSAQPVSRVSLLAQKAAALALALAVPTVVFAAAVALGGTLFAVGDLTITGTLAACVHLFLLALLFGAVALAAGAVTGSARVATSLGGGLAVAAWLADSMLPIADLDRWTRVSPWHYYFSSTPLANGVDVTHVLVLAGVTVIVLGLAAAGFARRDLKG